MNVQVIDDHARDPIDLSGVMRGRRTFAQGFDHAMEDRADLVGLDSNELGMLDARSRLSAARTSFSIRASVYTSLCPLT